MRPLGNKLIYENPNFFISEFKEKALIRTTYLRMQYIPNSYIQSSPRSFFQWIQEKRGKF